MRLTDQQYWMLASNDLAQSADTELQLTLAERLSLDAIEVFAYRVNESGHILVIHYTLEDVHLGLQQLYEADSELHHSLSAFVRKYAGHGPCSITGQGIGGAFGLYHAAVAGLTGVAFDAPGIGKLLTSKDLDTLSITNIAAEDSILPAIGSHPTPVTFAQPGTEEKERYSFDSDGAARPGEPNELFQSLTRISSLDDAARGRLEARVQELAEAAGLEPFISGDDDLMLMLHRLELPSVIQAIPKLLGLCAAAFQNISRAWRSDVEPLLHYDARRQGKAVVERTMLAAQEMADYAKQFHEDMEMILTLTALQSLDRKAGLEQLEAAADSLADELGERLAKAANELTDQLGLLMMNRFGA